MNVRTNLGAIEARRIALQMAKTKNLYIKAVYVVRDQHGDETDQRDFVFSTTMSSS